MSITLKLTDLIHSLDAPTADTPAPLCLRGEEIPVEFAGADRLSLWYGCLRVEGREKFLDFDDSVPPTHTLAVAHFDRDLKPGETATPVRPAGAELFYSCRRRIDDRRGHDGFIFHCDQFDSTAALYHRHLSQR